MKPVQTGFPEDSDGRLVARNLAAGSGAPHLVSEHAAKCHEGSSSVSGGLDSVLQAGVHHRCQATTLFAWSNAVSPHLAAAREGRAVTDEAVLHALSTQIASYASHAFEQGSAHASASGERPHPSTGAPARKLTLIEMAGGVCSPGPSGSLQVCQTCLTSQPSPPLVHTHATDLLAYQQRALATATSNHSAASAHAPTQYHPHTRGTISTCTAFKAA